MEIRIQSQQNDIKVVEPRNVLEHDPAGRVFVEREVTAQHVGRTTWRRVKFWGVLARKQKVQVVLAERRRQHKSEGVRSASQVRHSVMGGMTPGKQIWLQAVFYDDTIVGRPYR